MRWCTKIDKCHVCLSLFVSLELSLSSSILLCRRPSGFWSRPWPVASGDNLLHGCPDPPEALVMARLACPDHHHLQWSWSSPHYCHQDRPLFCPYLHHLQNRKVNLWLGKMTQGQSTFVCRMIWFFTCWYCMSRLSRCHREPQRPQPTECGRGVTVTILTTHSLNFGNIFSFGNWSWNYSVIITSQCLVFSFTGAAE